MLATDFVRFRPDCEVGCDLEAAGLGTDTSRANGADGSELERLA